MGTSLNKNPRYTSNTCARSKKRPTSLEVRGGVEYNYLVFFIKSVFLLHLRKLVFKDRVVQLCGRKMQLELSCNFLEKLHFMRVNSSGGWEANPFYKLWLSHTQKHWVLLNREELPKHSPRKPKEGQPLLVTIVGSHLWIVDHSRGVSHRQWDILMGREHKSTDHACYSM
jgi:hypothetical protein